MLLVASGRKSKRSREGQLVRSAVACEFDAEKAANIRRLGAALCLMILGPFFYVNPDLLCHSE